MSRGRGVIIVFAIAMLMLGVKFYEKSLKQDPVRARLTELCEGESDCLRAVEQNYDRCHGPADELSSVDIENLVDCLNDATPQEYFMVTD